MFFVCIRRSRDTFALEHCPAEAPELAERPARLQKDPAFSTRRRPARSSKWVRPASVSRLAPNPTGLRQGFRDPEQPLLLCKEGQESCRQLPELEKYRPR